MFEEIHKFKNSLQKYFNIIIGLFLCFGILNVYLNYKKELNLMESGVLSRLEGIATTLSAQLHAKDHQYLMEKYKSKDDIQTNRQDEVYYEMHKKLKETVQKNELNSPVYTLFREKGDSLHFYFGISSTMPYYRHAYHTAPNILKSDFEQGGRIACYMDEHGTWLSAFAPVKNSEGETSFVVQVDEKFDLFIQEARQTLTYNALIWLLGIGLLALGLAYLFRRLNEMAQYTLSDKVLIKKLEDAVEDRTEALRIKNEALKESNEQLGAFASVVSHDLKEPLRMITSYSQILHRKYKDKIDEEDEEIFTFILNGGKRMKNLIEGILNHARLNKQALKLGYHYVEDIVKQVEQNLAISIEEKDASIVKKVGRVRVIGDEQLLLQLFQNLIANAIKFQKDGVQPIVEIDAKEKSNGQIRIKIQDNGIGIADEDLSKIFKPFIRLHSRSEFEGSGIGLNTCRKIVKKHQGKIWVTSKLGEGTCFYIELPVNGHFETKQNTIPNYNTKPTSLVH